LRCCRSSPYFLSEVDAGVDGVEAAGALAAGAVALLELESDEDLPAESDEVLFASPEDFGLALP
jgi:hypothetical protein